ncbi:MAG: hypothetical protein AAF557_21235 [Pseudomonadota bacterium]
MVEPSQTALLILLAGYLVGLIGLFGAGFVILCRAWGLVRIERPQWLVSSTKRLLILLFGSGLFLLMWDLIFRVWQTG